MIRRLTLAIAVAFAIVASVNGQPAGAQPSGSAPPGQTEFVPLNELPPSEQLPAAPLLVTAYAVFLILMVLYVWTVWVRLNKVETEMRALEQRTMKHGR
jgi:hypothetical protein